MPDRKRKKKGGVIGSSDSYGRENTIDNRAEANDEVTDIVDTSGNINNIAQTLRQRQGNEFSRPNVIPSGGLAPFNNTASPGGRSTSINTGVGSLDNLGKATIPRAPIDIQQTQRSNFVEEAPSFPAVTPLGNFGFKTLTPPISELLAADQQASPDTRFEDLVTRVSSTAPGADPASFESGSPEARLRAAMANTNPAPRSLWRRLGDSLIRSAKQIGAGDSPESMLGKLIGNVIPGLVPSVDSRIQYDQNVERATRDYTRETALKRNEQATRKADLDIQETTEKIRASATDRATKEKTQQILNQTRLDNVTRQRAENIMEGLSKLPENDPQRDALAKILADPPYGIPVGRNYGLLSKEEKEATQAAKDNKPLSESDIKRRAEAAVRASYNPEEKARASTDARRDEIARNVRDGEFGGKITTSNRDAYNKRVKEEYERILASNKAFSQAEYDKLLKAEMDRLRGGATSQSNNVSPAASSPRRNKGARVPASNKAQATDYRGVTLRLPGVKR